MVRIKRADMVPGVVLRVEKSAKHPFLSSIVDSVLFMPNENGATFAGYCDGVWIETEDRPLGKGSTIQVLEGHKRRKGCCSPTLKVEVVQDVNEEIASGEIGYVFWSDPWITCVVV